jgi:hypothetical protein
MKKIKLLLLIVMTSTLYMSCSKSEDAAIDNPAVLLVGNWKIVAVHSNGIDYPNPYQPCDDGFVNFNANGSFVTTKLNCNAVSNISTGTYLKTAVADQYQFTDSQSITLVSISFTNNNTKFNLQTPDDDPADYTIWQKQ